MRRRRIRRRSNGRKRMRKIRRYRVSRGGIRL